MSAAIPVLPQYAFMVWLGVFAKLRKVAISFVTSISLCVSMKQLGFHWTDFDET
jgi:hypothetical protein